MFIQQPMGIWDIYGYHNPSDLGKFGGTPFSDKPSNPWIADLRGTPQAYPRRCPASTIGISPAWRDSAAKKNLTQISPMDTKNSGSKQEWIGLRENLNRKPWFLPSNIGVSCKFSHHPIL